MFGTGCAEPTLDECAQWQTECIEVCAPDDEACRALCYDEHDVCVEEAYLAKEQQAERADAIADASIACFAIAMCTLESLDEQDGDGDGDEWSEPEPQPEPQPDSSDDWGEDWGEQGPSEALELASPAQLTDLPRDQ
jgi:hypothetical protein